MSLTAGVLSQVSVTSTSISVAATAATGGTGPYTEAYYISTVTGFSPSGSNIVAGASGLSATITGLIPNTSYFIKVIYTDTGNSNVTVTATQLASVTSATSINPNVFAPSVIVGMLDQKFNYNTTQVQIDVSQVTALYSGAPVKFVDSIGGVPKVVGITAATDEVYGYINFDIKTVAYVAGSMANMSMAGNVIYLYATAAVARGAQVVPAISTMGGVAQVTGSSAANVVGWAFDKATAPGQLIRVFLTCPSFAFDAA